MSKKKKKKITAEDVVETTKEVGEQVGKEAKSFRSDFKKFIAKGNIIDLAVAVVIGTAFNNIVTALVNNIIMPLTGRVLISDNIKDLKWVLVEAVEADEANGIAAVSEVAVTYGVFLQAIIDFVMIALSIFIVLRVMMKVKDAIHRKEREAAAKKAAEEKARKDAEAAAEAEKKRLEAEAEAERQEKIKNDFLNDVAVQADVLEDIKRIMLRMERRMRIAEEKDDINK